MTTRILFNGLAAVSGGGVGRYAAELGRRLALADERVTVVCTRAGAAKFMGVPAKRLVVWRPPPIPSARLWLEEFHLPGLAENYSLLYQPDFKLPRGIQIPSIVTTHDLFFETFPEDYGFLQRRYKISQAKRAAKQAAAMVSLTSTQAENIAMRYPNRQSPRVIPPGISAPAAPIRNPASPPFLLCLAGREERKRGLLIARANESAGRPILVKWVRGPKKAPPGVESLPRQTDAQLAKLFSAATALTAPSRDEGFGLPVLEAIAANCPVLCSDIRPFRESFGDAPRYVSAAIYDAEELGIWINAIRAAAADPPQLDAAARAKVLARHDWPRAIAAHLALIEEILSATRANRK